MPSDDPREELRAIAAGFRCHLESRARDGLVGISRLRSPRGLASFPTLGKAPGPSATVGDEDGALVPHGGRGLTMVREEMGDCQRCALGKGRRHLVFGCGNPDAHLMFVGEAPGGEEDEQGDPFVGAAGKLLTRMIEAMRYRREDVYICNVVKCRPPDDRDPEPTEVAACEPFLKKQIAVVQPRVIVALGKFAAQVLTGEVTSIARLRGNLKQYQGIPVMPTYHPAHLLRDEGHKREAWHDLQQVMALLHHIGVQ